MGAKLSLAQWSFYFQVAGILLTYDFNFSKGLLKCFVRWIFHRFPGAAAKHVQDPPFCVRVGEQLGEAATTGDRKVYPFMPLCAAVINALKKSQVVGNSNSVPSSVSLSSPAPASPRLWWHPRLRPAPAQRFKLGPAPGERAGCRLVLWQVPAAPASLRSARLTRFKRALLRPSRLSHPPCS